MAKYFDCRIQFVDDLAEEDVIIKENEEVGDDDDEIFFYGITEEEIIEGWETGKVFEGEWRVVDYYGYRMDGEIYSVTAYPYAVQYGKILVPEECKTHEDIEHFISEHFDEIDFGEPDLDYEGTDFEFYRDYE